MLCTPRRSAKRPVGNALQPLLASPCSLFHFRPSMSADATSFYTESAKHGSTEPPKGHTYKQAGVDIREAAALVGDIGQLVKRTQKQRQLAGAFGLFAAAYDLSAYKHPVIVTGCDGVGTKIELLLQHDLLENAGKDLVAMNVNDVLTTGADPILFLDYVGIGRLGVQGRF